MKINHEPLTDTDQVEKYYGVETGGEVRYICTTELDKPDVPVDIFYKSRPKLDDHRGYFGIYWDKDSGSLYSMNADMVEGMQFAMVEKDGLWHYSSTVSDEKIVDDKTVGGGRQSITGWGFDIFALDQGVFIVLDK